MTDLDLGELERLLEKATPGPWEVGPDCGPDAHGQVWVMGGKGQAWGLAAETTTEEDAALIAAAVNALPALIAAYRALEGESHDLTKALTGLTVGGSEFFVRKGERFVADIDACVTFVRERDRRAHVQILEAVERAKRAEEVVRALEGEREGKLRSSDLLDKELAAFLQGVTGLVEATNEEKFRLWQQFQAEWTDDSAGLLETVGTFAGMPVCVSLHLSNVRGERLLFYHATSRVVDHRLIDQWIEAVMPATARRANGRVNKTDAANFPNVFRRAALAEPDGRG